LELVAPEFANACGAGKAAGHPDNRNGLGKVPCIHDAPPFAR
jgi:hypothetical protein